MRESSGLAVVRDWDPRGRRASAFMVLVLMLAPALWAAQTPVRERLSFNADWRIPAGGSEVAEGAVTITHPKLWGPPPQQQPHRYVAVTTVWHRDRQIDRYETPFGIRDTPEHGQGGGIRTPPQYPAFRERFPDKLILSAENAAALSTRGTYLFPVIDGISAPVKHGSGGDSKNRYVSAYELHAADFGSSADKVFASQDRHPYVAGGFVWSGWDYLGEPTPHYSSRSSYFGIIDLAGFKKDRFYLYQAHWRPNLPMAHILPHWTWPERVGQATPVHVFTSGDEAELFLNGKSLGRKTRGPYEYRFRWDEVLYEPGELKVVAYRQGKEWAQDVRKTAGPAARLLAEADRSTIAADGLDLSFVTIAIVDQDGVLAPRADSRVRFSVEGPGEIVATDNGDPTSFESFQSRERNAFNGLCLAIVRGQAGRTGTITLRAESEGLVEARIAIRAETGR